MSFYPFRIQGQRTDKARNMARFCALSTKLDLFGEVAVVRRWEKIGTVGGEKRDRSTTEREAAGYLLALAREKLRRGYKPVGDWKRHSFHC